jgi:hypothetical protein
MFLIRTAFWVGLVVLVLPTDREQQARLYTAAVDSARHAATYCDRNQATCHQAGEYWAVFQKKLEFGARLAFDLASERMSGASSAPRAAEAPVPQEPSRSTLTPADLQPAWRGKTTRTGA